MSKIAFLPSPYEDELLYSVFARYHIKSGNIYQSDTFKELYGTTEAPDTEFLNRMTNSTREILLKQIPIEDIVMKHTMFNQYARFIPKEDRINAFNAICNTEGNYYRLLHVPYKAHSNNSYLRYCPLCVKNDRKQLGETYWHRKHQLRGINICPIHHCKLYNSEIKNKKGFSNISFLPADNAATEEKVIMCNNDIEIKLTDYVYKIFTLPITLDNNTNVCDFLQEKIEHTLYYSQKTHKKNIKLLCEAFLGFYPSFSYNDNTINELWKIRTMFFYKYLNLYEVAQLGLFFNIDSTEFQNMKQPLNTDAIRINNVRENQKKRGPKPKDYQQLDIYYLPIVKKVIKDIIKEQEECPKKVTPSLIQQELKLPRNIFYSLPMCYEEIISNMESQESFWLRKIQWGIKYLKQNNKNVNFTNISQLLSMRKSYLIRCLKITTDDELKTILKALI